MKKLILISVLSIFLFGCSRSSVRYENEIHTYCDAKYGVEYIGIPDRGSLGVSVRLDENGDVVHCEVNK